MFLAQMPAQAPQLPDLPAGPSLERARGPVEIPLYEPWQIALMVGLGLLALGILIWIILRIVRARRNRPPKVDPRSTAIAQLKAASQDASNDDEQFAVLSSLALRRYFETGKGIPTLGRTTLEFLQALDDHPQLTPKARHSLSKFLTHCDRVKFARVSLNKTERDALTESAIALVEAFEHPVEPTATEAVSK